MRAPLTTCPAEKRKTTRGKQGAQVSLHRNTQMFAPCPRRVLERTRSASLLVVKRASGTYHPCAMDFVYTLIAPFSGATCTTLQVISIPQFQIAGKHSGCQ